MHDADADIPTDITSYEIEPFGLNDFQDKSYLTLVFVSVYRDDDDDKYIILKKIYGGKNIDNSDEW